jgi:hypothetical protein
MLSSISPISEPEMPPHEREGAARSAVKPPGPNLPGAATAHHEPAPGAADPFHAAFLASTIATKEARRLADVEFRFVMRFKLRTLPGDDAPMRAAVDRLCKRRRPEIDRAEDAHYRLATLWNDASDRLCCVGRVYDQPSVALRRLVA